MIPESFFYFLFLLESFELFFSLFFHLGFSPFLFLFTVSHVKSYFIFLFLTLLLSRFLFHTLLLLIRLFFPLLIIFVPLIRILFLCTQLLFSFLDVHLIANLLGSGWRSRRWSNFSHLRVPMLFFPFFFYAYNRLNL